MAGGITGKAGVISIGSGVARVTSWSMNRTTEAVDVTGMDDSGNRAYAEGLFGWEGTFTTLTFLNLTGEQATATFQVGASAGADTPTFTGKIIITNEPISTPVDGRIEYAYTFTGSEACTAAVA